MKWLLLLVFAVSMLQGCGAEEPPKDPVEEFIIGTYSRSDQQLYGTAYDTVVFTMENKKKKEYKIVQRWIYARMKDGVRLGAPDFYSSVSYAVYDPATKSLSGNGEFYKFDLDKRSVFIGSTSYQKIE